MTEFHERVLRPEQPDFIVRSLLDIDFYKLIMGYFIYRFHRGVWVKFGLISRHLNIPLAKIIDEQELRRQLDHVRTLKFRRTDLIWLRGQDYYHTNMFSDDFLKFLGEMQLPPYSLTRIGDQYALTFEGPWEMVTYWETLALAIVSELRHRALMQTMSEIELRTLYGRATDKLYRKLCEIKKVGTLKFADFGQRRRHSFLWQSFCIKMARQTVPQQFTGTSNAWMSFHHDLAAIGTNAHELQMVLVALAADADKLQAQYGVLEQWEKLFPQGGLRIMLPDTYGTQQFLANMPEKLARNIAHNWRGMRQDSGDPFAIGIMFVEWFKSFGVNPIEKGKLAIFSDGLDVPQMIALHSAFEREIPHAFGWGTNFTNDFRGCHPHGDSHAIVGGLALDLTWDQLFAGQSIVCKVVSANDKPTVKLSDNIEKATGAPEEIEKYLEIFGKEGRIKEKVSV